jgi:hypothetical protein
LNQAIPTLLRQPWREASPGSEEVDVKAEWDVLAREAADFLSGLSGVPQRPRTAEPEFFHRGDFQDFSLLSVALGYGGAAVLAIALATLHFCRLDL